MWVTCREECGHRFDHTASKTKLNTTTTKNIPQKTKQANAVRKQRERKQLYTTSHREVLLGHILGSGVSKCIVVAWVDRCVPNESTAFSFPAQLFLPSLTSYGREYPFGHFRSAVLPRPPPQLLPTPCLLALGWIGESSDGMEALLSNRQNTGAISVLF